MHSIFPMAPAMLTVATSGISADRFAVRPWVVWAFLAGVVALVLLAGAPLASAVLAEHGAIPGTTDVMEWDVLSRCARSGERDEDVVDGEEERERLMTMGTLVSSDGRLTGDNAWAVARALKESQFKPRHSELLVNRRPSVSDLQPESGHGGER